MNERLGVEMLWLEFTKYNMNEEKKYVNELEWVQYQLDNFESIQQVTDHLTDLKIYPIKGKVHYILSDKTGESVIIEYLNGTPTAYKKEANVCQTITNNSVLQSEQFKSTISGKKKNNTISAYRYYQLEQEILNIRPENEVNESFAFNVLKKVAI
ncbi:MAG: linear amide C-N hydrolase [Bacteroidales bacterium]|nr:linear amide C-N hydrolase [Bacteroidales bacterium]